MRGLSGVLVGSRRRTATALVAAGVTLVGMAAPPAALALGRAPAARPEVGIEDQNVIFGPAATSIVPVWRSMGIDSVRVQAFWDALSPETRSSSPPPGFNPADPNDPQYNWAALDRAVDLVLQNGMSVNLTINQCNPRWAGDEPSVDAHCWRPNSQLFAQFAGAVARRYGSRVNRYLLGSEPNQTSCSRSSSAREPCALPRRPTATATW
jgi:hypothetical protein